VSWTCPVAWSHIPYISCSAQNLKSHCGILDCGIRVCHTVQCKRWLPNFWSKLYSRSYTTTRLHGFARKTKIVTKSSKQASIEINDHDPNENTNSFFINPK
jgi:hypothetical protein